MACGTTDIPFNELPPVSLCSVIKFMGESFCDANMARMVYHLQTSDMTDEEWLFMCFTHCQLRHLKNWPDWDATFDAQLDADCKAGCIGIPVPWPTAVDGQPLNILHIYWTNGIKSNGTCKAHACIDG